MKRVIFLYINNLILLISFILVAITGILKFPLWHNFFGFGVRSFVKLHDWSGIIMVIAVLFHLILNFHWMINITKALFKKDESPETQKAIDFAKKRPKKKSSI